MEKLDPKYIGNNLPCGSAGTIPEAKKMEVCPALKTVKEKPLSISTWNKNMEEKNE